MGSVFAFIAAVVSFIAENIYFLRSGKTVGGCTQDLNCVRCLVTNDFTDRREYEFIFPFRGVIVDRFTLRDLQPRSEEARDASIIHHAQFALLHYNSKNQGAEFDLVKPLMVACVLFRGEMWYHISFWARARGTLPETPVQQFFSELHYRCTCDGDDDAPAGTHRCRTPVVETCVIVSQISTFQPQPPARKKKKPRRSACILCPPSSEIFHPKRGRFVCGKEEGHEKEFIRLNNLLEKPFTCTT